MTFFFLLALVIVATILFVLLRDVPDEEPDPNRPDTKAW